MWSYKCRCVSKYALVALCCGCESPLRKLNTCAQGRSQDLVSGGGTHFGGGGDPLFFSSDPKSQGSPLCTFGYPRISGGGPPPPLATPVHVPFRSEAAKHKCVPAPSFTPARGRVPFVHQLVNPARKANRANGSLSSTNLRPRMVGLKVMV